MSEHEARVPSDPTSEPTQSDLTAQVPVAETTVLESTVLESTAPDGASATAEETNLLEVPVAVEDRQPLPDPAHGATYAAPGPTYAAPEATYAAPAGYPAPAAYGASGYTPPPAYGASSSYPQQPAPPTYGAPPAPLTPENERQIGALAHAVAGAATVLSAGFLGFVAALVIYLIYKDRGPFVRANAAAALNVQITMGIGLILSGILMIVLIGLVTYPVILVAGVVLHVLGAVKAWNGEWWTPPLTIRFVK